MPFIVIANFSISTLVKGPFTAPMQRAVALRSYFHMMRIHNFIRSLEVSSTCAVLLRYEDSHLRRAFDMRSFSPEELHLISTPDPAEVERLRQICQRGGETINQLWCELAPLLHLRRRPFTAAKGDFDAGWALVARHAGLEHQQRKLQDDVQRQRLPGQMQTRGSVPLPHVVLRRSHSEACITLQLEESHVAIRELGEKITTFDAKTRQAACTADENPEKAVARRGEDTVPRSRVQMATADENPEKAVARRGEDAMPRSRAQMGIESASWDENPEKAVARRGEDAVPRSREQMNNARRAGVVRRNEIRGAELEQEAAARNAAWDAF